MKLASQRLRREECFLQLLDFFFINDLSKIPLSFCPLIKEESIRRLLAEIAPILPDVTRLLHIGLIGIIRLIELPSVTGHEISCINVVLERRFIFDFWVPEHSIKHKIMVNELMLVLSTLNVSIINGAWFLDLFTVHHFIDEAHFFRL